MRKIEWQVVLTDTNQIATLEHATGVSSTSVEDQLMIIGILENLKQSHLTKLNTLFQKTVKKGKEDLGL